MAFRFLFTILIGCAFAVRPYPKDTIREEWRYDSRIMTGLVNPRETFAGGWITMNVIVNKSPDYKANIEFKNVEGNIFNNELYIGDPSEHERRTRENHLHLLEGQFTAYLNKDSGVVMEVPPKEPMWVTNLRKGVLNMLRIPSYIGDEHFDSMQSQALRESNSQQRKVLAYKKAENIFAGRCNVSYTMAPDFNDGRWPDSSDSVLPSHEYYRMRRSVDFDSCKDAVRFQKVSTGNFSHSYKSEMKEVMERNTVGEYLLGRLSDGSLQMKGINQIGELVMRPFGQDAGRIVVHTNQTLALKSFSKGSQQVRELTSSKPIRTWLYQFVSPAKPHPKTERVWIEYLNKEDSEPIYPEFAITGEAVAPQDAIYQSVDEVLKEIVKLHTRDNEDHKRPYNGTITGRAVHLLKILSHGIRALDQTHVKRLLKSAKDPETPEQRIKQQSMWDALAASGSGVALRELISEAKQGRVPKSRMTSIFGTLANNMIDPIVVPELLSYVKSINEQDFMLNVLAHLNFAKLVQRVCINEERRNYTVPEEYLGQRRCDRDLIENDFIPHLKNKIEKSDKTWLKLMYIQSLGLVGEVNTIDYINEIILNTNNKPQIRMGAIHAFISNFKHEPKKDKVISKLLPIVQAYTEDPHIREAAFIALMYMKPNETVIERLVMQSFNDPSSQMQSVVSSTIIGLAQSSSPHFTSMNNIAKKMMPLLRVTIPSSRNNIFFDYKTRIPDYKIDMGMKFALASQYSTIKKTPRMALFDLQTDFGGIGVNILHIFALLESTPFKSFRHSNQVSRDAVHRSYVEDLAELQQDLQNDRRIRESEEEDVSVYVSILNTEIFLGLDGREWPNLKSKVESYLGNPEKIDLTNYAVKFLNPVDVVTILPTPFGVPAFAEVAAPQNLLLNGNATSEVHGEFTNFTYVGSTKLALKMQAVSKLVLPWMNTTAVATIDTEVSLDTPGVTSCLVESKYPFNVVKCTLSPDYKDERPVLYLRSKPMTALRDMKPTGDITSEDRVIVPRTLKHASSYRKVITVPESLMGLKARILYEGDVDYPLTQSRMVPLLTRPERLVTLLTSPTESDYSLSFRMDIRNSETKNMSFSAVFNFFASDQLPIVKQAKQSSIEVGKQLAHKISNVQSPQKKLKQARKGELGDFYLSLSANYTAPNKMERIFDISFSGSNVTKPSSTKLEQTFLLTMMTMGSAEERGRTMMCLMGGIEEEVGIKQGRYHSHEDSDIYSTIDTHVYAGKSCSDSSDRVGRTKIYMRLNSRDDEPNPSARRPLQSSLFFDRHGRAPTRTQAIYDRIDVELTAEKEMNKYWQNITNRVHDLLRGFFFPHVLSNKLAENRDVEGAVINITRNVPSGKGKAWMHSKYQTDYVDVINFWPLFDWASPLLGPHQPYDHTKPPNNRMSSALESSVRISCQNTPSHAMTFDGVQYDKKPTSCWTVLSQVLETSEPFVILHRQPHKDQNEIKIIVHGMDTIELLPSMEAKVKGQVIRKSEELKDKQGQVKGSIQVSGDSVVVSIPSLLEVQLTSSQRAVIRLPEKYRSRASGLCGDFNNEQQSDLKGPKGCIYRRDQTSLFVAAWVAQKESCQDPTVAEEFEAVHRLQSSCKKQ